MNPLAKAEIDDLIERGITPTPEEIVALNALANEGTRVATDATDFTDPRRMVRHGALLFREPSIGQVWWAREAAPLVDLSGVSGTVFYAFVTTREHADLPSPHDRDAIKAAVNAFSPALANMREDVIAAVISWCWAGPRLADADDGKKALDALAFDEGDWRVESVLRGVAIVPGLSLKSAMALTQSQLGFALRAAMRTSAAAFEFKKSVGPFYRALDAIEARAKAAKEAEGNG